MASNQRIGSHQVQLYSYINIHMCTSYIDGDRWGLRCLVVWLYIYILILFLTCKYWPSDFLFLYFGQPGRWGTCTSWVHARNGRAARQGGHVAPCRSGVPQGPDGLPVRRWRQASPPALDPPREHHCWRHVNRRCSYCSFTHHTFTDGSCDLNFAPCIQDLGAQVLV